MPRELRPLARRLRLRAGTVRGLPAWRGDDVVAVAVGVGPARAGTGAAMVLDELAARRLLVTGVAGAVDPALKVADVIRPTSVVDVRTGRSLIPHPCPHPSSHPPAAPGPSSPGPSGPGPSSRHSGVLATVAQIFLGDSPAGAGEGPGPRGRLPAATSAVDMETAAIAAVAEARGVPWDVVRAISDVAGTLTPEIAALLGPDGTADVRAAGRLVLRDPRVVGRLARLGIDTARALRALTAALAAELAAEGAPGTVAEH